MSPDGDALRSEARERHALDEQARTALAVETALRNQQVDMRLTQTEKHLEQINGSQARTAEALRKMNDLLMELKKAIDTGAEVAKALAQRRMSTRTMFLALIPIGIALTGLIVAATHLQI